LALLAGLMLFLHRPPTPTRPHPLAHEPTDLPAYPTSNEPADLRRFVEVHKSDSDAKVQDLVGHARIELAYSAASRKDWKGARSILLTAAREYKGTNAMSGDFGGVPDQARYQAAACLMASGKKDQARAELLKFMHEDKLSPLCHAAYRRLVMLNGNKSTPELENLLQSDVAAQEQHVRFETSVCGPKCIEWVVRSVGRWAGTTSGNQNSKTENQKPYRPTDPPTYAAIAALCGTTDKGTTIAGMRKGLKALGYQTCAYSLNAKDLARAPLPAILLIGDHFVVLERLSGGKATIYDPRFDREDELSLPKDESFAVSAILLKPLDLDERSEQ
jgi:hypothetical protein